MVNFWLEADTPDPMIVDALVARYPVPGASTVERAAAAAVLRGRGWDVDDIAAVLRTNPPLVQKWLERERDKARSAARRR